MPEQWGKNQNKVKGIQIGKEEVKLSAEDDMTLHAENPKITQIHTKPLLQLINKFSKFEGYKITTQKSISIHYPWTILNRYWENEPFTVLSKKN